MKRKQKKRIRMILIAAFAAAVMIGFAPQIGTPVYANASDVDFSGYVNTTTAVKFNGLDWYVIGYNGNGVQSANNTVTLFSAKYIKANQFDNNSNDYNTSGIKKSLEKYYLENFKDVSWTVNSVDLTDVDATGERLWLLSLDEARTLPIDIKKNTDNTVHVAHNLWWLRTPTEGLSKEVEVINGENGEEDGENHVGANLGTRPALQLNLALVDFNAGTKTFSPITEPPAYTITMTNSTGSFSIDGSSTNSEGNVAAGTRVTIKANDPPEGQKFIGWKGADSLLFISGSKESAEATFIMPAQAVSLTAVYAPTSNHKHDGITFNEWTDELAAKQNGSGHTASDSLPAQNGNYYLTKDVDLGSRSWEVPSGTTSLCMNGHGITSTEDDDGAVLIDDKCTLNLYDEHTGDSVGTITDEEENGVCLNDTDAVFNMYGGKISGCEIGVDINDSEASCTLHNGTITENDFGVYYGTGTCIIAGANASPRISGNTKNLFISGNGANPRKIGIAAGTTISDTTSIGISMVSPEVGIFTDGLSAALPEGKTAADIFSCDDSGYYVGSSDGEAQIVKKEQAPDVDPRGNLDLVEGKEGGLDVAGWAFDPSDTSQPIDIYVYIGGEGGSAEAGNPVIIKANLERKDVDNAFHCGDHHGFSQNIQTGKRGEQTVYVYAINIGDGKNTFLGSRTVTITDPDPTVDPDPSSPVSIKNAKVVLSASAFAYNGKVRKPAIRKIGGKALKAGTDYTAKWSNKSSRNVGAYKVTITGKGNYTGVTKATYKINPKGTSLKKPEKGKKTITVKWKKQSDKMSKSRITGYQIQLATNKKFTKNKKTVTVKGYKKVSKEVKKLKGGKKYYVKICTYKTIKGKKFYSKWSKVKTVKTKK